MSYEPGFYWVRWDRRDGEWTVGELTNYGWNVVGCNISDLRVGKDIIEVGAAIHRQSHSLPGEEALEAIFARKPYPERGDGEDCHRCAHCQYRWPDRVEERHGPGCAYVLARAALTPSPCSGDGMRALLVEARETLAAFDRYSRRNQSELLIDVDTGRTPTDLIAEIDAALTPSANPKCAMCLGDKVVGGETCSRCGGVGYRTSTPSALSGEARLARASREAIELIDELNERATPRKFWGISQTMHNKLCTIRVTLARALPSHQGAVEP